MNLKLTKKIVIGAAIALSQASCQTGYFETKESITPAPDLTSKLLKDVLVTLQNNFPPAKTKIFFEHDQETLAMGLESSLRRLGYALTLDDKDRKALTLGYKLSKVDQDHFVLTVVVGHDFQFSRIYSKSRDGDYRTAGPMLIRRGGS